MPFPIAPDLLPEGMNNRVEELARIWSQSASRPTPSSRVVQHWNQLIENWVNDAGLPLLVRKFDNNRGSVLQHESGRFIVPVDNSPAPWALSRAVAEEEPTLEEIRNAFAADAIPVAMAMSGPERASARYRCNLTSMGLGSPNGAGWKVCHIKRVGLAGTIPIGALPEPQLREHFRRLMAPGNMFVIPKKYSGLGELPEFCDAISRLLETG